MSQAKSISVVHCEHGNIHITLYGEDGQAIVCATMEPLPAGDFLDELATAIEACVEILIARARPN